MLLLKIPKPKEVEQSTGKVMTVMLIMSQPLEITHLRKVEHYSLQVKIVKYTNQSSQTISLVMMVEQSTGKEITVILKNVTLKTTQV